MKTYIALLRGINVSGQKKIRMADLKTMMEGLGFENVQTYIQSGNIVFKSVEKKIHILEDEVKYNIANTFGFDVPVLVKTRIEILQIIRDSPFTKKEDLEANRIYYTLLQQKPDRSLFVNLKADKYPNELFQISKNCVYLNCTKGAGKAKLNNNSIERELKVTATTRNHSTMLKLLELSKEE